MLRFTLLFLLASTTLFSQSSKKISSLIAELNNDQFIIDHTTKAIFTYESKAATKLIKQGYKAKKQLVEALNDSSRVVMVQLVLCHYWFKKATFAGPKIVSEGEYNVNKYFLGEEQGEGLIVSEIKMNGKYISYARAEDREKIILYWKKKFGMK